MTRPDPVKELKLPANSGYESRRRFLARAGGLAVLGLPMISASGARAFSVESGSAPIAKLAATRCSVDPLHAELIREARATLATEAERDRFDAAAKRLEPLLTCPVCGCPVIARAGG